jgi:hypothetical protein
MDVSVLWVLYKWERTNCYGLFSVERHVCLGRAWSRAKVCISVPHIPRCVVLYIQPMWITFRSNVYMPLISCPCFHCRRKKFWKAQRKPFSTCLQVSSYRKRFETEFHMNSLAFPLKLIEGIVPYSVNTGSLKWKWIKAVNKKERKKERNREWKKYGDEEGNK